MSAQAAPTCPNCQAPLPLTGDSEVITCEYCGRQVMRPRQPPVGVPPEAVRIELDGSVHLQRAQAHVGRIKWLIILFAVLPLLVGGIVVGVVATKAQRNAMRGSSGPGGGGYTPEGVHLQWNGEAPIPVDIDEDGVEDFIGRYNVLENGDSRLFVGAFDGKTITRRWKAGPYGGPSDARTVRCAVSGDRALVSDASNFVHVLELTTGKELFDSRMTDKVKRFCPFPEDGSKVWIEVADEQHVTLDMATAQTEPTPRPGWCPGEVAMRENSSCWSSMYHRTRPTRAECRSMEEVPHLSGFRPLYVLADGEQKIAFGVKDPGTRLPMVVGFAGAGPSAEVKWSRNVAADAYETDVQITDLVDGRAVLAYQTKQRGWQVAALDAATGNTIYDVDVPRSDKGSGPSSMRVTASRIYVPHWTWLDIFEAATGEHLGTVGIW